jgi:hypothetical protein
MGETRTGNMAVRQVVWCRFARVFFFSSPDRSTA